MAALRSILFNICFFGGSLFWSVVLLPFLFLPPAGVHRVVSAAYGGYLALICRYVMGLKLELRGLENLPATGSYILAAKHQSAYETFTLTFMLRGSAMVLKRELTWFPLWGWYPARMGLIPIDRGSAMQSLDSIVRGAKKVKAEGRPILLFPQGTRVAVGDKLPYKIGVAKVYEETDLPVVPMALNSGVFWGRNKFLKKPGTVVFEFLPAIPPGLPPRQMMKKLEEATEAATDRLVATAQTSNQ